MSSTMEKINGNQVKLRMELSADAFEAAVQKTYLKNRGRINVPGFRRGKAPRSVIERMYGAGVFFEEAFDDVFPGLYEEAVKETGAEPVGQPEVDMDPIEPGKPLSVTVTVYVRPEVTLGEYKGLDVQRGDDTVEDDSVEEEIIRVRKRNARETDITDRPVQDDDIVTLDYAGTIDGVAFEGGTAQNQQLTIGSGQFIPGFEEQMIGMTVGEERDLSVTFPAEYHNAEVAGKPAVFHVKVSAIKVSELPELDDEFAKDVSAFDTLDAYRADIRAKLESEAKRHADAEFENELVAKAVENASMDVPPPMIERQIDNIVRDLAMRMAYQGIQMEQFYQYTGQTEEQLRSGYREEAERRVKGELVLDAICKAEGIEADEAGVEDVLRRYAEQSGKELDAFRKDLTEQQMEYVRDDANTIATLNFLKENAKRAE